jgi:hypothetical protein
MTEHELIDFDEIATMLRERAGPARPRRRVRRLRRSQVLVASVLVALLVVGAALLLTHGDSRSRVRSSVSASCAAVVQWQGVTYSAISSKQPVALGEELGNGVVPACGDTIVDGKPAGDSQPMELKLSRVVGIPEREAVASADGTLWVSPGYFPQLPGTAIHDAVFGADQNVPDERAGDCTRTADVRATVRTAGLGVLDVDIVGAEGIPAETPIFTDARTQITGGGSPPRVEPGEAIQAAILVCRKPDDPHFLKLVATRLAIER